MQGRADVLAGVFAFTRFILHASVCLFEHTRLQSDGGVFHNSSPGLTDDSGKKKRKIINFHSSEYASVFSHVSQCTGSSWAWSPEPSCRVAPPPCTCATTCWSSPGASRPSPSATGSCRRYAATAPCPTASCSREGPAVDTVSFNFNSTMS